MGINEEREANRADGYLLLRGRRSLPVLLQFPLPFLPLSTSLFYLLSHSFQDRLLQKWNAILFPLYFKFRSFIVENSILFRFLLLFFSWGWSIYHSSFSLSHFYSYSRFVLCLFTICCSMQSEYRHPNIIFYFILSHLLLFSKI